MTKTALSGVTRVFSPQLAIVVNILLSAVIGYLVVKLALSWLDEPTTMIPKGLPKSSAQSPVATKPTELTAEAITGLFGLSATTVAPTMTGTPPDTPLNLKLYGVYFNSENPDLSYAMIATPDKGGKTLHYKVGQTLPAGVTLHQVHAKYVILMRNGRYETLRLINSTADNKLLAPVNQTNNLSNSISPPPLPISVDSNSTGVTADNNSTNTLTPEKLLGNYQQQLKTNPAALMRLAKAIPAYDNGQFIGVRLKPSSDASVFEKFGLQTDDILTEINGTVLDSPLTGLSLMQQLASANQIAVKVLRNGQPVSLSFNVDPQ
ncbi:type II secretory pathway, component PulC [Beggiatoa alba B18LD]|uniref:Type II secretory pathway, component PulC n=1 Tax=Beggiatoa alba B18LD TaxID=395493 RepID=I3CD25_9GAMM|nr:type II secretion system protein N [Beggiatoa alba]EIJ41518.1 type II secretory pathway, component PulC [Beggiatoa alba B18LD]